MTNDVMHSVLTTWAAKDIPARLFAGQVAKVLNCTPEDVAILAGAGKLRALGKPRPNAVKYFRSIELITLLADPDWLDDATKSISQYWKHKNARRHRFATAKAAMPAGSPPNDHEIEKAGATTSAAAPLTPGWGVRGR